mmetsp:Transcript_41094/g.118191  ORF Transcript_41094/g.118191 Transcript_41094/m.118191 type:complete len:322 (-) Transcript_41094:546-1511(-)
MALEGSIGCHRRIPPRGWRRSAGEEPRALCAAGADNAASHQLRAPGRRLDDNYHIRSTPGDGESSRAAGSRAGAPGLRIARAPPSASRTSPWRAVRRRCGRAIGEPEAVRARGAPKGRAPAAALRGHRLQRGARARAEMRGRRGGGERRRRRRPGRARPGTRPRATAVRRGGADSLRGPSVAALLAGGSTSRWRHGAGDGDGGAIPGARLLRGGRDKRPCATIAHRHPGREGGHAPVVDQLAAAPVGLQGGALSEDRGALVRQRGNRHRRRRERPRPLHGRRAIRKLRRGDETHRHRHGGSPRGGCGRSSHADQHRQGAAV